VLLAELFAINAQAPMR